MANRMVGRTYGSLDDSASKQNSSEYLGAEASNSLLENGTAEPAHQHGGPTRRRWITVAVISAMAVGTIMATKRSRSVESPAEVKSFGTLAENLPKGAIRSPATSTRDYRTVDVHQAKTSHDTPSVKSPSVKSPPDEDLVFSMTNFYHTRDGKPGQVIPWLKDVQLAEPHRDTTMKVENALDGYTYEWEVRQVEHSDDVIAKGTGAETTIVFPKLDWNTVTLKEKDVTGTVTREYSENVMVKYVRREIRTLTDEEREELFDAVSGKLTVIVLINRVKSRSSGKSVPCRYVRKKTI